MIRMVTEVLLRSTCHHWLDDLLLADDRWQKPRDISLTGQRKPSAELSDSPSCDEVSLEFTSVLDVLAKKRWQMTREVNGFKNSWGTITYYYLIPQGPADLPHSDWCPSHWESWEGEELKVRAKGLCQKLQSHTSLPGPRRNRKPPRNPPSGQVFINPYRGTLKVFTDENPTVGRPMKAFKVGGFLKCKPSSTSLTNTHGPAKKNFPRWALLESFREIFLSQRAHPLAKPPLQGAFHLLLTKQGALFFLGRELLLSHQWDAQLSGMDFVI